MKKIFTLLAFLTIYPCLAQTIQITKGKDLGDGFLSMVSKKMQNYHQHKDCQSAIQIIKESNEDYFLYGFINGIYANTDCLDKEPIRGRTEMALYMTQGNSTFTKGQGMNYILEYPENPKTIGFYNKVEGLSFLVGYYYATKDGRIPNIMKKIVEKSKKESCLKSSENEQDNLQCPHKKVFNFATEFLNRYDTD